MNLACLLIGAGFAFLWYRQLRRADAAELQAADLRGDLDTLWSYAKSIERQRKEAAAGSAQLRAEVDRFSGRLANIGGDVKALRADLETLRDGSDDGGGYEAYRYRVGSPRDN